jgi:hypothetical protein
LTANCISISSALPAVSASKDMVWVASTRAKSGLFFDQYEFMSQAGVWNGADVPCPTFKVIFALMGEDILFEKRILACCSS